MKPGVISAPRYRYKYSTTLLLGAALSLVNSAAFACGYHDPDSVSFKTGVLNWMYPDSLHVNAPIWQAQKAGVLPRYDTSRMMASGSDRKFLDAVAYQKTERVLKALGAGIGRISTDGRAQKFSIVLVENALWTQFSVNPAEQIVNIDTGRPGKGDLVMVTGEPVIHAISKGRLTLAGAFAAEMLKLYGKPEQIDYFLSAYGELGAQPLPEAADVFRHVQNAGHKGFAQRLRERLLSKDSTFRREKP